MEEAAAMNTLTRKDVTAMLGELDDVVTAKIIATGAAAEELAEAHAWLANDEPLMRALDECRSPASERPRRSRGRHRRRHQRGGRPGRNRKAKLNARGASTAMTGPRTHRRQSMK